LVAVHRGLKMRRAFEGAFRLFAGVSETVVAGFLLLYSESGELVERSMIH
jgi:hypothetical protein